MSKPQEEEPDVELELSQAVRLELFLSHPCSGKYGDDGEMQCNQMPCFIDFKRDFPSEILAKGAIHRLLLNSLSQSQPVADGGGLPEEKCDVCCGDGVATGNRPCICGGTGLSGDEKIGLRKALAEVYSQLASSQEALRVARESALRLIPAIKHIQGLGNDEEISGEIMLALENLLKSVHRLSPEGSSR